MPQAKRQIEIISGSLPFEFYEPLLNPEDNVASGAFNSVDSIDPNLQNRWTRLAIAPSDDEIPYLLQLVAPNSTFQKLFFQLPDRNPLKHSYELHQRLQNSPIQTPRGKAYGCVKTKGFRSYFFLCRDLLPDTLTMDDYLSEFFFRCEDDSSARDKLVECVGERTAAMHDAGFYNEDVKLRQLLMKQSSADIWKNPRLMDSWIWANLEHANLVDKIPYQGRLKNLHHMWRQIIMPVSKHSLEQFLVAYCSAVKTKLPSLQKIKKDIERHSD